MILARIMPNSNLHREEFFSGCHPIPQNKTKEYIKNTKFSSIIYLPALAALLTTHLTAHNH
jgi:hypothetical protein